MVCVFVSWFLVSCFLLKSRIWTTKHPLENLVTFLIKKQDVIPKTNQKRETRNKKPTKSTALHDHTVYPSLFANPDLDCG